MTLSPNTADVSRETLGRLDRYVQLLLKWNNKINLIGRATEQGIWARHIQDSLQLVRLTQEPGNTWLDMGSGGGLPGLVVAIAGVEQQPDLAVTLVESDARKCAFLRTAIRELELSATVKHQRIEDLDQQNADVVSARALAPLADLLSHAAKHLANDGVALFPKGESWKKDLTEARKTWHFACETHKSETNPQAVILRIGEISHV